MAGGVHLMWPSWNRCALVRCVTAKSPSALGRKAQAEGNGEQEDKREKMNVDYRTAG